MVLKKNYLIALFLGLAGAFAVFAFAPANHGLCLIISILSLLFYTDLALKYPQQYKLLPASYLFGFGFFVAQLYWFFSSIYVIIGAPLLVAILAIVICNGYLALYVLLSVWLYKSLITKSDEINYLLVFPSAWVIGEWLRGWVFTGFSWGDVAYTQVNNYLLQGFFPVIGSYGVSWLTMSIIGFVFLLIKNNKALLSGRRELISNQLRLAIIYFIALAISGYALHGKQYTNSYGRPTKIALVQGNIDQAQKWQSAAVLSTLRTYASLIARAQADLVLLPETAFVIYEKYLPPHYLADIVNFAESNHTQLVIGMPKLIDDKGNYVNAAVVVTDPKRSYYAKSHLVPYGEYTPYAETFRKFYSLIALPMVGFSAGSKEQPPLIIAKEKIAFNICYENGFGSELIPAARNATLMVNLSDMVWYGKSIAKDLHLQLSQARALENQRYFIQETNSGMTAIIDPFGKVVARLPEFKRMILTDYVQGMVGTTPYQNYGNYPVIIFSIVLCLVALLMRRL